MLKKLTKQREFMIFLVVVAVFVIMSFASPYFLSTANILAVLLGLSVETIIAVGMVNLMVSGGFDLSVGSVVAFTGSAAAMFIKLGVPVPLAVLLGLGLGALIGLFNGVVVSKIEINAFVTTLSSLSLFRGLTMIISGGQNLTGLGKTFKLIGQANLVGVQMPIWYAILLVAIGDILLRKSRFFRQSYYIGGNEHAARLSGVNVDRLKNFNFLITGFLAALAGIVMTSRLGAASVTAGGGLELRVITAVIIGGASLRGGEGTVLGAFLGSFLMTLITNALTLLGVDVYWQTFVIGATLLIAVLIDRLGKMKEEGKLTFLKKMVSE
jgi:ribose transport system permease protein